MTSRKAKTVTRYRVVMHRPRRWLLMEERPTPGIFGTIGELFVYADQARRICKLLNAQPPSRVKKGQ